MIAIDTLVHNFLERTGILSRAHCSHLYGPACYGPDGCADFVRLISAQIDAASAKYDYLNRRTALEYAIGTFR